MSGVSEGNRGGLFNSNLDFFTAVGLGLVPGATRVAALGNNPDVDTTTLPEDIWTGGGTYPWMTAATSLEVLSSSANDTSAGTGARTIVINGLDINYVPVTQTITLNGVTPVAVPTQLFRINSSLITSAGSGKVNAGDITIRDAGGGTTRGILPVGYGMTRQAVYTVPAGFTLQIISSFFGFNEVSGGNKFARISNFIQSPNGFYRQPFELSVGDEPPYRHDGIPGIILSEKTDFALRCTQISNDNSNVSSAFLAVLFDNTKLVGV